MPKHVDSNLQAIDDAIARCERLLRQAIAANNSSAEYNYRVQLNALKAQRERYVDGVYASLKK